jgi:predicted phosphodiesterase
VDNRRISLRRATFVLTAGIVGACGGVGSNEQGFVRASVQGDMRYADMALARYDTELEVACGAAGVDSALSTELVRWPYLQQVTANAAQVLFTSASTRQFRLVARTPEGTTLADVAAAPDPEVHPTPATQYVASLANLPPSSTICYELSADGNLIAGPTGFRTAPDPEDPSTIRFVAMGDLGKRSPDQLAVLEQMRKVPMDFMVLTGDVAYDSGTREQLEAYFFGVYRDILQRVPVFPASGNHDYETDDARPFRDAFSLFTNGGPEGLERWYSFDWGPVHFVVLDTEKIGQPQVEWLEADLRAHDRPWTVAIAHRPPYSSGDHGSNAAVRSTFTPIFEAHGVPLVLLGHDHNYERTKPIRGVVYVVTGGGGRGTREVGAADFTAVSDRVAHFVWVEADAATLRLVAIDGTGQSFDSVAFTHG